jgi:hypothetical protein
MFVLLGIVFCDSENRIKKYRIHNCVFALPQFIETRMIARLDSLLPLLCSRGNVCVCLWANCPRLVAVLLFLRAKLPMCKYRFPALLLTAASHNTWHVS